MLSRLLPCALALVAVACGGRVDDDRVASSSDEHHPRFTGFWMLDEDAARGGYSGAIFEFGPAGQLARRHGVEYSGSVEALGSVHKPDDSVTCGFGPAWRSVGNRLLVIETACTDGRVRDLTLEFVNDAATNVRGATVRILDVGGEMGWEKPRHWGWKMKKCTTEEACLAEWS